LSGKSKESSQGLFDSYVDIMVYAASIGCANNKRVPFDKAASKPEPIREQIFDNDSGYSNVPSLLAFFATDSVDIFDGSKESADIRIKVLEEYACGGLGIIEERLKGEPNKNNLRILAGLLKETIDNNDASTADVALPDSGILGVLQE